MEHYTIYHPRPGVFLRNDGLADITVWAPEAAAVALVTAGEQPLTIPLEKGEWGYWRATTHQLAAGDRYRFLLNNKEAFPDPASVAQPEGVHGPSEVADRQFAWTDDNWKGLPLEDLIIYELHTGAFSAAHTFEGIIEQLPYLQQLGITAIELMPVNQFPGNRNWGYDGVYVYAVHGFYGGLAGLKRLVNAAHAAGIAVILDVVYNHLGPDGNYLEQYGPYFTGKYKTPWGKALNFDDAWCDGVRNYFLQNVLFWLDECRIDGLRLDAVHAIWDFGAHHIIQQISEAVKELEEATGRTKILIAEIDLNNPRYIQDIAEGGYGLQGQWSDEFHHALHSVLTGEVNGYYEDFGRLQHLEKAFRDTYVYDGNYSPHRKRTFGLPVTGLPYSKFVVFSQNHDQIGNRLLGDRLSASLSEQQLKLAAAAVLLSPHLPLLFMGEEYGEKNPFLFFVHHENDDLIEVVRRSRREEFAYFQFEGDFPDPQSETVFESCILTHSCGRDEAAADMFRWYQQLIQLRKTRPAMRCFERDSVQVWPVNEEEKLLLVERTGNGDALVIVFNFSNEIRPLPDICHSLDYVVTTSVKEDYSTHHISPFAVSVFEKKNS
ncbi:maltooligosyltrehalose trehalohydrolase [Filimonas zeae]|uniref:Malto-oligosyltrehalose trehalohydrolase n=1 Tax=Filimonas zeae TaxID=1737353 RepID=A0A917J2K0_9BACT|nr:malto-oligosyltrehalose trehalohydrolase [Filimonas zeae]MDR6341419.1 maltooligosyltrehalose trehalohydrolase [Filimonas zeae]GGH75957.1 malto-oligosyltrehalose trehalohydrolase [Filimonas zeae]